MVDVCQRFCVLKPSPVFAHGPVIKRRTTDLALLFSRHGLFLSHWLMLAMLRHQLEAFQDTHTEGLPKGQAGPEQKQAGPVGGEGT